MLYFSKNYLSQLSPVRGFICPEVANERGLRLDRLHCHSEIGVPMQLLRSSSFWLLWLAVGQISCQSKPFPFGPRRRILPGQRSSGCSDCAAELKQCILTCVEKFDCSEMNVKEGFCPVGEHRPDNCSISSAAFLNVCKTDTDCPGTKKCCQNGCSKVCSSALPVPPHQVGRRHRNPAKQG